MADDAESKEFIAGYVKALEETVRFFSPQAKEERERWVVEQFLSFVRPGTPESEVQWVDAEPWDALCLEAKLQVKEVQEPGRRRHAEFKEALAKAKTATDPKDLLEPYTPTDITAAEVVELVLAKLGKWTDKYAPEVVKSLDLLVYLNIESSVSTDLFPDPSDTKLAMWRSVSVVCNDCAFVLSARSDAPDFLRSAVGAARRRSI